MRKGLRLDILKVLIEDSPVCISTALNLFCLQVWEHCFEAADKWQSDGRGTLVITTPRQLKFLYGHLHGGDNISSGVTQRTVKVEYDQFYFHHSCTQKTGKRLIALAGFL